MKTTNENNFSILGSVILPIVFFLATLPFKMLFGIFEFTGGSINYMAGHHAKDYIKDRW